MASDADRLLAMAKSDFDYAADKAETLGSCGVPVPDPLRRLGVLAAAVCEFLPTVGASAATSSDGAEMRADVERLGKACSELRGRLTHSELALTLARTTLYTLSQTIGAANAKLDGSPMAGEIDGEVQGADGAGVRTFAGTLQASEGAAVHAGTVNRPMHASEPAGSHAPIPGPPAEQTRAQDVSGTGAMVGARLLANAEPRWPASGLFHGLLLEHVTGRLALFSEPIKGQFSVQGFDTSDAPLESFSVSAEYLPGEWVDAGTRKPTLAKYDEAKPEKKAKAPKTEKPSAESRTISLPGLAPVEVPKIPPLKDYVPSPAKIAEWSAKFTMTPDAVRALAIAWATHADRADKAISNPEHVFGYYINVPSNRPAPVSA